MYFVVLFEGSVDCGWFDYGWYFGFLYLYYLYVEVFGEYGRYE